MITNCQKPVFLSTRFHSKASSFFVVIPTLSLFLFVHLFKRLLWWAVKNSWLRATGDDRHSTQVLPRAAGMSFLVTVCCLLMILDCLIWYSNKVMWVWWTRRSGKRYRELFSSPLPWIQRSHILIYCGCQCTLG